MKKVLVLTNALGGLYRFRAEIIYKLLEKKFNVVLSAPDGPRSTYFKELGCRHIVTPISRRSTNPIADLILLFKYISIIRKEEPDIVLTYTIKPNVYGGIACQLLNIPYITNITGLGTSIEEQGIISKISLYLYRLGIKESCIVFFQNSHNKNTFEKKNIVTKRVKLIPGSGVNLNEHKFEDYPESDDIVKFLFIGRIMRAKGINELLEASEKIKNRYTNVEFHFVGSKEEDYSQKLTELEDNGVITYHGRQDNVNIFIKDSHAIINPSYHEGMSNVLLEAASTGRPILASDVPGCRETFDEGISGFKFKAKDVNSLVDTIIKFIELPYEEKKKMGLAGKRKMEKEFDRNIVVNEYIEAIETILEEGVKDESI